jgi:hypothetical protein
MSRLAVSSKRLGVTFEFDILQRGCPTGLGILLLALAVLGHFVRLGKVMLDLFMLKKHCHIDLSFSQVKLNFTSSP